MLGLHLDNILFLLFVAVAILFQLLSRAATKTGRRTSGDQKRRSISPPQPRGEQTEEDRIRKFLEALGQPTSSAPPPPVKPRPTYQKPIVLPQPEPKPFTRSILSPLPPLTTRPPDWPTPERVPPQAGPTRERKAFKPESELPAFEVHRTSAPSEAITEVKAAVEPATPLISKETEAKIDVVTLLRSASGLRQAILLREIFGPPRSLQPLDLVGTV